MKWKNLNKISSILLELVFRGVWTGVPEDTGRHTESRNREQTERQSKERLRCKYLSNFKAHRSILMATTYGALTVWLSAHALSLRAPGKGAVAEVREASRGSYTPLFLCFPVLFMTHLGNTGGVEEREVNSWALIPFFIEMLTLSVPKSPDFPTHSAAHKDHYPRCLPQMAGKGIYLLKVLSWASWPPLFTMSLVGGLL